MKKLIFAILFTFMTARIFAQTPAKGVQVDGSGVLLTPTNFFSANAMAWLASLSSNAVATRSMIGALATTNGVAIHSLTIQTNTDGVDGINGYLNLQPNRGINWGTNTFTSIWYNQDHSGTPELQFGSDGSFSFTEGMNQQRKAFCHWGGSGHYHGIYALQYDEDRISTNWNGLAETLSGFTTNNGYSHFLDWCGKYWDVSLGQALTRHVGFRMEVADNTTTNVAFHFYSHIHGWHQDSTVSNEPRDEIGGTFWIDENYQGAAIGFPRAYITNTFDRGVYSYGNQSSNVVIDFKTNDLKTVTLTGGAVTFITTNRNKIRLGGREVKMRIFTDSSTTVTNLAFPVDWQWVDTKPTSLTNDSVVQLRLTAYGTTDNDIVAEWKSGARVYALANSEALAYVNAAGISNNTYRLAIDSFVTDGKTKGYWNGLYELYPFFNDSGSGATNAIGMKGHNIVWHGTVTHTSASITGDGSTGYGDLGFAPSGFLSSTNEGGIFVWNTTTSPTDLSWFIGCSDVTASYFGLQRSGSTALVCGINVFSAGTIISASGNFNHFFAGNRNNATTVYGYADSSSFTQALAPNVLSTKNIYICCRNNNGTPGNFSNGTFVFAGVIKNMSDQNVKDLQSGLATLKAALGK